jgi:hypothetical protein
MNAWYRRGAPKITPPGTIDGLMKKTLTQKLTKHLALVALALASGTLASGILVLGTVTAGQAVAADQAAKTAAQWAVEQFIECAGSLFKDEFEPAEIDYQLGANKEAVLDLSAKWGSRDNTITILTRIRSIGSSAKKELIMTQNGQASDELPAPAARVKEYIAKVFEECPLEKEDHDCADAVIERFNGIEQVVRHNLEYPHVTVEKYTANEQGFRASKEILAGIDDYYLTLNGATEHKSFEWRTLRPMTPTSVEEVLHNPPPRVARNGSDIRKLQGCIEDIAPHIRILRR